MLNKYIDKRYVHCQQINKQTLNKKEDNITKKKEIPSMINIYLNLNQYILKISIKNWKPKKNLFQYKKYKNIINEIKLKPKLFNIRNIY